MNIRISSEERELFEELQAGGIPVHRDLLERIRSVREELSITSDRGARNAIFDPLAGGVVYLIRVLVKNRSDQIVRLKAFRLETPLEDPRIHWLRGPFEDFLQECARVYPLFKNVVQSADILNDRFGRKGTLCPGDYLDGFLLGWGETSIPWEYDHRQPVPVRLAVYDSRGNCYHFAISLLMRRWQVRKRNSVSILNSRGPLFSKRDKPAELPRSAYRHAVETYKEQVAEEQLSAARSRPFESSEQRGGTIWSPLISAVDADISLPKQSAGGKEAKPTARKRDALGHSRETKRAELQAV